jgi:hypothetical protein
MPFIAFRVINREISMNLPKVSFVNNEEMDIVFLLYSSYPNSFTYHSKQKIPKELETLAQDYGQFAKKNGLYSPRDGLPKFHFLCASLVGSQGSVFPDVNEKYRKMVEPFHALIANGKTLYSATKQMNGLGDFFSLWKTRYSSLENAQKIARITFRFPEYSIFLLLSLSSKFGMPCMVHDKYIFVNAQEGQEAFIVDATFHELLHQLLLGSRCKAEGKFFVGHFLWQPRRAMIEEIVIPCLQMELCEDSERRKKERERVLHLDEHLPFLKPFRPLFPKILRDWEEKYMLHHNINLQTFIDKCTRQYLNPLKFMSWMHAQKPLLFSF